MKSSLESRFFLLCIALFISVQGLFYVMAAETDTEETDEEATDYACSQTMIDQGGAIVEGYQEFLDGFFNVDAPTSDQLEDAMDFYRYIEDSLLSLYRSASAVTDSGAKTTEFASKELTNCAYLRDQYIEFARALLQKQALGSAYSKTTFEVVDGLKALNEDLDDLSKEFSEVFPGAFHQMNNALPCYARQCIVK